MNPRTIKLNKILFSVLVGFAFIVCSIAVCFNIHSSPQYNIVTREGLFDLLVVVPFCSIYGALSYVLTRRILVPCLMLCNMYSIMHVLNALFNEEAGGWLLPSSSFQRWKITIFSSVITFIIFSVIRIVKSRNSGKTKLFVFPVKDTVFYGISAIGVNALPVLVYYGVSFIRKTIFFGNNVLAYNNGIANILVNAIAVIVLVFGFTAICSAQFNNTPFIDFVTSFWVKTKKRILFVSVVSICLVLTVFGVFSNRTILTENGVERYGMFGTVIEKKDFGELSHIEFEVGTKVLSQIASNSYHLRICVRTENGIQILDNVDLFQLPETVELCLDKTDVEWNENLWSWSLKNQSSYGVDKEYREELEDMIKKNLSQE